MNRFYLVKESLVTTGMILIITFGISFIPLKFEFIKGIRQEFLGFDIYDLNYTRKHLENNQRDANIVIVEVGSDRSTIAGQISLIKKYSPALICIDVVFDKEGDSLENNKLLRAISRSDSIIFANRFVDDPAGKHPVLVSSFFAKDKQLQSGYNNIAGDEYTVIRYYRPFYKVSDSVYPAFTSSIIEKWSPEKFDRLKNRNKKMEIINYTGNLKNYDNLSKEQLKFADATGQLKSLLSGRIVLLGYFDKEEPLVMEDLYFSPLNERVAGKSLPDMYGVVIHANILSMILKGNYAKQASDLVSYLFAGLITFLFLLYILSRYKKRKHPKHGWFLLLQFGLILFILFIFLVVFREFHIKVPLLPIMISLVLCVELLGLYRLIALWLNKKYQYKTVFNQKHDL